MKIKENDKFEKFLIRKNEAIYRAAQGLVNAITAKTPDSIEEETSDYRMEIVGEIADFAERILQANDECTCYPYYVNETPCYEVVNKGLFGRSEYKEKDCPFKEETK